MPGPGFKIHIILFHRFMYCEEANISADTALPLMYAAKKYLLLNLVDRCQKFLQENLDIENVCCILELSLIFDENQLRERCLAFIGKFTPEVLKTDGFLQISRSTLEELVKFNILTISEVNLFNACIVWARHQLQLDNTVSAANDAAIRDCLGSVLYRVRFPNIGQEEFARTFGKCGILSSEEKLALYYYFNTKEDKENLPFDGQLRRAHEDVVSRFGSIATGEWIMNGRVDAIDFMTDRDIVLIGLGLYGSPTPGSHDMSVEIWNGKILLCIVATKFESTGTETQPVKVYLGPKVKLKANTNNTIVTMIKGSNTRYGCNGKSKVVSGGITFIFSSSQKHTGRTGIECGQIPELYFTSPELRN